jgi:Holliday junction resolvase RusA-like endonuclease
MKFQLPIRLPTATPQGKRFSRVQNRFYAHPDVARAIQEIKLMARPHRPAQPWDCPVAVVIEMVWAWRETESKRNRAAGLLPKPTRPDVDNAAKLVLDGLDEFFSDDARVISLCATKFWGDNPGITVEIFPLTT